MSSLSYLQFLVLDSYSKNSIRQERGVFGHLVQLDKCEACLVEGARRVCPGVQYGDVVHLAVTNQGGGV